MTDLTERTTIHDGMGAGAVMNPAIDEGMNPPAFSYDLVCIGPDGKEKWRETIHNLVTTVGKTDIVDKYFKGSAYTAAWYLGLKGTGTAVVGDTLASHAGWAEVTPYSGNRPAISFGTTSSGSNTATAVSYTINASATVAGAFLSSVNTGTSGTLYSAGDFASSRTVASGDTLNVTPTVSVS
ncbi:hypothetical protein [Limnoglobus roseus]|uniref:Uncharacterized protein n=1 Tax=Limnoglobus roseus TaxID=2598579 RepID=A0A5C1AHM8_9BACT|nr:hypothetical protein [Limnoglobus roseus]QEL18701.1 hypothetical protein PX52LOC_05737 [Limnoglobus roseus]